MQSRPPSSIRTNFSSSKPESKAPVANSTLWKERQLRDFRKANGLCMYCGDKFDKAHATSCVKRQSAQVNTIVVNDLDHHVTEEVLRQLDIKDNISEEFEQLSLNVVSGTSSGDVLKLQALVRGKVMLLLLDSGSSHSFVNFSFLQEVGIQSQPNKLKWQMEKYWSLMR
ncbi:hypothetical protein PAHAL_9G503600 [Panicum hallii]|jgi:hypothetical protein|uniref:Uncharacterized protein n=1 Tax=Panicum hallii TaxID=206008 RepID=A0A2T8I5A4_9POAL|nr:hypothetical protein PAHAL_9G503600 [Panicum hallii]